MTKSRAPRISAKCRRAQTNRQGHRSPEQRGCAKYIIRAPTGEPAVAVINSKRPTPTEVRCEQPHSRLLWLLSFRSDGYPARPVTAGAWAYGAADAAGLRTAPAH